jgi:hypothetical protein
MKRSEVLKTADDLINGDRAEAYGDAHENFGAIAQMWNAYLMGSPCDVTIIQARDVANMMALLKVCRMRHGPHDDSSVDGAAYLALASELADSKG